MLKTYDQWKSLGYHVIKGSKSKLKNKTGLALFSDKQVDKNKKVIYDVYGDLTAYERGETDDIYEEDGWGEQF